MLIVDTYGQALHSNQFLKADFYPAELSGLAPNSIMVIFLFHLHGHRR